MRTTRLRMKSWLWVGFFLLSGFPALAQLPAPTGFKVQAKDINRVLLLWNRVTGAQGYKVLVSTDSVNFTEAANLADTNRIIISNLTEGLHYEFQIRAFDGSGDGTKAATHLTLPTKKMMVSFPLNALTTDSITDEVGGKKVKVLGTPTILDAATSGLTLPALKFTQDELGGVYTYADISPIMKASTLGESYLSRTISFWLKNETPSLYTVPISFEKRTGMSIAFKNDSIWVFTKHRPGSPWYAHGFGIPYKEKYGTSWVHVAYVYHEPYTDLYLNGEKVGSILSVGVYPYPGDVAGGVWPYPGAWGFDSDKDYEIGCLKNPCAALAKYLGDSFDPGTRRYFNGAMAKLRMYNYEMAAADIKTQAMEVLPVAPTGFKIQARDPERVLLLWNRVSGASGYKVMMSTDSVTFSEAAVTADTNRIVITGLTPATTYHFHIAASNVMGYGPVSAVKGITTNKAMVLNFKLDGVNGTNDSIAESVSGKLFKYVGPIAVKDAASSGLGTPAIQFVQNELDGIYSYADISAAVQASTLGDALMSRTVSFWLKNETPSLFTVPLSFEKRTGMSIAFKNDSIWAFTKQRPASAWYADGFGVPYKAKYNTDWVHITYVYSDPVTELYINGEKVGSVNSVGVHPYPGDVAGGAWPYPGAWQWGGDKDYEIGCLKNPCAAIVKYLGDGFDPGTRKYFNGMMRQLKGYNYALSSTEIMDQVKEFMVGINNFKVQAYSPSEVILKWDDAATETGYKVEMSVDSSVFTEAGTLDANVIVKSVGSLTAETKYWFKVTPLGVLGVPSLISFTTPKAELVARLEFKELVGDTAIQCSITGKLDDQIYGTVSIENVEDTLMFSDGKHYSLGGMKSIKFHQDELNGIKSYVRLINTLQPVIPAFAERSISFWAKNNNPSAFSVPLSIEKRTGMSVVYAHDSIWAFTKHRPRYPSGVDYVVDGVGAPFSSDEWNFITYVYNDPVTSIYVNGVKLGDSKGGTWAFPTNITIDASSDKSAEIGCQLDPDAATATLLGDTWDPGARRTFDGELADMKFFNYALTAENIQAMMMENLTFITGISSEAGIKVEVYPNPASHMVYVKTGMSIAAVEMIDNLGRIVLQQKLNGSGKIDVSALQQGIYLLKVKAGGKSGIVRVSINR